MYIIFNMTYDTKWSYGHHPPPRDFKKIKKMFNWIFLKGFRGLLTFRLVLEIILHFLNFLEMRRGDDHG